MKTVLALMAFLFLIGCSMEGADLDATNDDTASSSSDGSASDDIAAATSLTLQEGTGLCSVDGSIQAATDGFLGDGYADTDNAYWNGVSWAFEVPTAGDYTVTWRYANADSGGQSASLLVNGSPVDTLTFTAGADGATWVELSTTVTLSAGVNTVRLEAMTSDGLADIDSLTIDGSGLVAYPCGYGDSSSDTDSDAESGASDSLPASTWYACDDDSIVYDAEVVKSGDTWTVTDVSGIEVWSGSGMQTAIEEGLGVLDSGRTEKQSVVVRGDGTIDAASRVRLYSYTVLNVCGTIDVQGTPATDMAPIWSRGTDHIDIPNVTITGTPAYGMFFRNVSDLHIGHAVFDLDTDSWEGVRIDNNPSAGGDRVTNVTIDAVAVSYSGGHGVETHGVDGLTIGTFVGDHTQSCGVLLNNTVNAEVGSITCNECAYVNTGYAAFRAANSNGKIDDDWPAGNVHVGSVYARGGGRGIFSVSGSGGLTIDNIDLADNGNHAILLQNAYNTTIAAESGKVAGNRVLLGNDYDNTVSGLYLPSYNVTLSNLSLTDGATIEEQDTYCDWEGSGDLNNRAVNITGGTVDMCYSD
ncbi:carbohydrate-binding protein [Marinobacter sp. JSM 1782161]|uniref:carbohydrate-binding protein n=1 Tax=Marinobacter sp. JSM 1782161 TaxID=2685906 RepID=UPI001402943E|nr:CBM35 domain-containing protein [Marinobacter sp. JSM 1782161]